MDNDPANTPPAESPAAPPPSLSFGQWLKEKRVQQGISLEEIAAVTKVHISYLRSLEEDNRKNLPPPAFVRGFLVSFARHIGQDEDDVLERYRNSGGETPPVTTSVNTLRRSQAQPQPKLRGPSSSLNAAPGTKDLEKDQNPFLKLRTVAIGGGVIVIIGLDAFLISLGKKESPPTTPTEAAAPSAPAAEAKPVESAKVEAPKAETPVKAPEPVAPVATPVVAAPVAPAKAAVPEPPPGSLPLQMELKALEQSWVNVRVDDGDSKGLLLKGGGLYPFQAQRKVQLTVSNAGGIEIRWNGTWYSAPGYRGDVKALTLPEQLAQLTVRPVVRAAARPKPVVPVAAPAAVPAETPPTE
jgi:cytoskeletal protein RodZ